MNRIIYKNKDNTIGILTPSKEVLESVGLQAIAEKDVPQDLPYWLVDETQIPTDRTFRNAWEIDESFGSPDGFGGESNEFSEAQLGLIYLINLAKKIVTALRETIPNMEDRILEYEKKAEIFENEEVSKIFVESATKYDLELEEGVKQ